MTPSMSPVSSDPIEVAMTDRQSELSVAEMTADHDTTPIPTDVLRAWVERVNTHLGPFEDVTVALHRAAVAALPPPRRPVTRDTPLGTEVAHVSDPDDVVSLIGWDGTGFVWRGPEDARYYTALPDGWYEVDEPEPAPLPGTRVGERMTEHTPVGATVEREECGRRKVKQHREDGLGAWFDNGMWTSYETAGTVVALPEESEREADR